MSDQETTQVYRCRGCNSTFQQLGEAEKHIKMAPTIHFMDTVDLLEHTVEQLEATNR